VKLVYCLAALVALLVAGVACGSGDGQVTRLADQETTSQLRPDAVALLKGPVSADGTQAIFATPDLGVGENRVGFVLTSAEGLVRSPAAAVSSLFFPDAASQGEVKQTALAVFKPWPYGTRGLYSTVLSFDRPGRWGIDISVLDPTGPARQAQLRFEVKDAPAAPPVGSPAIRSVSKTARDVQHLGQLTTGSLHDPELYQTTIADAVASGLPTVVVMASPAFCINAVCGPQVEVLQELKNKYRGRANFIHVDLYDNPEEIQGDLSRARLSPTVMEWRLPSAEWSFVIDSKGVISARFESFATLDELEQALQRTL
jgi:hypothetical protein